jgi:hypothetical protein
MNNVILAIIISGFFLIIFGLTLKKYPKAGWYLKLKNKDFISNLYESKFIGKILDFFTKNKNGFINRASKWVIDYTETDITLNKLCFYKVISVILVFLCLMSIKQTNLAVMKESIIAKPAQRFVLDLTAETKDFQYNMNLYTAVVKKIGTDTLKKLNNAEKAIAIREILPELLNTSNKTVINMRTDILVDTINRVNSIRLIDWKAILIFILSLWLPELLMFAKRVFLTSAYRKEIIRLENVFELLGEIPEIRTSQILEEMRNSSKLYKKQLNRCLEEYNQDKKLALDTLKVSIKNKRFSSLVDSMRIFSFIDRQTGVSILSKNKLDKEEDSLLLSEEDVEASDIIALISIAPIIYRIMTLLLKPMVELSTEAFKILG